MRAFDLKQLLLAVLTLCAVSVSSAQQDASRAPRAPGSPPAVQQPSDRSAHDDIVVTEHVVSPDGERIAYTATAGTLTLTDEAGAAQARIFFVAYTRKDVPPGSQRPITFAFNGGPGASSMWLHLGVGPRHVALPDGGTRAPQSTAMTDNPGTWLRFTDLVFIDPVGSGFSRAADGVDAQQFYEVVRDIDATAAFIRRFLTRYERWLSPKFVAGESYGTTRAAGLVARLQDNGIDLNGVILISSMLDFQTIAFEAPNDLSYALVLPSYVATAWYHKLLPGAPPELLREAERWSVEDYLVALTKGASLPPSERARVAEQLARFTALDREELLRRRLRITPTTFGKGVLGRDAPSVGRFDSRVTSAAIASGTQHRDADPSFFLVTGPWYEALNDYLKRDLQVRSDLRYESLSREANRNWKWRPAGAQGYLYVSDDLADAMTRDARLRVFVAAGIYDLATPYFAQKYALDHMELEPAIQAHLRFETYRAGHQIYTDPESAMQLKRDVERFVECAVEQTC